MSIQIEFIKSIPYFSGLDATGFDSVGKLIFTRMAERGEIVLFEGEPAATLYFVVSGVVKVFKTSAEGKEQILYLVRPGESFNDTPVFGGGLNLAGAEALGPVTLYGIKKSDLETVLKDYPPIVLNVIRVLSQRVQDMVSLIEDLSFKNVTGRVAKILLENAGSGTDNNPRLTQQEMAAMAGTAREMVGRSLKTLEEEGIIRFERHRIVVTSKRRLEGLAGVTA